ncbi:MAG: FG-GAP and VCBS repeat-containing protein [Streptosporangiaceae bacterium]
MKLLPLVTAGALAAVTVMVLPGQALAAKAPAKAGDFNGDGRRDIALGIPDGLTGGETGEGLVSVIYTGSKKRQNISVHSPGVSTVTEHGDGFGSAVASADFDQDGYSDLAVAGREDAGITLIYGSRKGLSGRVAFLPTVDTTGLYATTGLAVADFDRNGRPDLVVTVANQYWIFSNVGKGKVTAAAQSVPKRNPYDSSAALKPLIGDVNGDHNTDLLLVDGTYNVEGLGVVLVKGVKKGLGTAGWLKLGGGVKAAVGDINGDGKTDLMVGGSGKVRISLGKATGLTKPLSISQKTPGMPGVVGRNDWSFGEALASRDLNRDGRADLVIGNSYGGKKSGGTVIVLFGGKKGITTKRGQVFSEDTKGVPWAAKRGDNFGAALSLVDLNNDSRPELVVGAPGENKGHGLLYVFKNSKGRIAAKGVTYFTPKGLHLKGSGLGGIF